MLYSYKGNYPEQLPNRIRLSNGLTVTDPSTFSAEQLADAGYVPVADPPVLLQNQTLSWTGTSWVVETVTSQDSTAQAWAAVRTVRDGTIANVEWRISRYFSQVRLGIPPQDDIVKLDTYVQALRDITKQPDPHNILWPEQP